MTRSERFRWLRQSEEALPLTYVEEEAERELQAHPIRRCFTGAPRNPQNFLKVSV